MRPEKESNDRGSRPVTSIFDVAKVQAMEEVAAEFGVRVEVLAGAGEEYTPSDGIRAKVRKDGAYVALYGGDPKRDLIDFYKRADQVLAERQQQQ